MNFKPKTKQFSPDHYCLKANNYFQELIYNSEKDETHDFLLLIKYIGLFLLRIFSWRKFYLKRSLKINNVKKWFLIYGYALFLKTNSDLFSEIVEEFQSMFKFTTDEYFSNSFKFNISDTIDLRSLRRKIRKDKIYLPISRENIEISINILKSQGKKITFRNIMSQIGFSSNVIHYNTIIPTDQLMEFELLLRESIRRPTNLFKIIDENRKKREEVEREKERETIKRIVRKAVEAIERLIVNEFF